MGGDADIEKGLGGCSSSSSSSSGSDNSRKLSLTWPKFWPKSESVVDERKKGPQQVEDYPKGYPQFSALISSHPSFALCRRFLNLRTRLLLQKQDRLAILEKKLERLDREEKHELTLGSMRRDTNEDRQLLFSEIDAALVDYDCFLERHQKSFKFDHAPNRAATNLQNWVAGTGAIARAESEYLQERDLISIGAVEDNAATWLEAFVEDAWVAIGRHVSRLGLERSNDGVSRDASVHIFAPSSVRRAVRILLTPLITLLLLAPVVICNFVRTLTPRLLIVVIATTGFIAILSSLTRARTVELIVAGATYTTVLVVFISGNDGPMPG